MAKRTVKTSAGAARPLPPGRATVSRGLGAGSRAVALSALAAMALALVVAAVAPLIDRDEPEYAQAVREMRAGSDWLVPRNAGRLFPDKPPGIYWLQAASVALLGESELALRLPGILATGLLVVLTAGVAGRLGVDARTAGTLVLPGVVVAGAFATPDAPVAAASALSLWAFLRAADGADGGESALLGWVALAGGVALKGPAAPLFVGAAMAGRLWRDAAARRRMRWLWGGLLLAGLTALWFVPANLATGWEYARRGIGHDVLARALRPLEHHGLGGLGGLLLGPPFYALTLLAAALPAGLAPLRLWRRRATLPAPLVGTITAGVVLPFALLSLVATKLPHYVLPMLPLFAVAGSATGQRKRAAGWTVSVVLLAGVAVAANLAPWRDAGRSIAAGPPAVSAGAIEPSLRYYARGKLTGVRPDELVARARRGEVLALLSDRDGWPGRLAGIGVVATRLEGWQGLNLATGRWEAVALYRLSPVPAG